MKKVKFEQKGPFTDTECPHKFKKWNIMGKEKPIMAGSYSCRVCSFHVFLPLAGKNVFGCTFK